MKTTDMIASMQAGNFHRVEAAERMEALVNAIAGLAKIATGELSHAYNGMCPDQVEGALVRDPDCPACQALLAAKQLSI